MRIYPSCLGSQELDVLSGHFGEPKTSCDGTLHVAVICEETFRQELLTFKRAADLRCTTEMRVTRAVQLECGCWGRCSVRLRVPSLDFAYRMFFWPVVDR